MRRLTSSAFHAQAFLVQGAAAIAGGLAILTAAMLWPGVPVVTAVALVALGATSVTLGRFRRTAGIVPATFVHLAIYGGLYAIFLGASLDLAATRPTTTLEVALFVDIVISIVPLGLAVQRAWCDLVARIAE
jgi:hypothetical protein